MLRLLERLEVSPSSIFVEQDLRRDAAEDFETWRSMGLLRQVQLPEGSFRCQVDGTNYVATRDGDGYVAVEADELEPAIIRLEEAQVRQWTAEVPAVAILLQRENGLQGPPERVRCWSRTKN
jgi:hypothetical protein